MIHPYPRIPSGKTVTIYPPEYSERRTRLRSRIVCFSCNRVGHWKSECATWKTRLCTNYTMGTCRSEGSQCPFAHGVHDLRITSRSVGFVGLATQDEHCKTFLCSETVDAN